MGVAPEELAIRQALQAGMAHHDAGRLAEAEAVYRHVLAGAPRRPEPMVLLAALAHATGRPGEAVELFGRAIAVNPGVAAYHHRFGLALEDLDRTDDALLAHAQALVLGGAPGAQAAFARCLAVAQRAPADPRFRELVTRAVAEAWARPADLERVAIGFVRADPRLREAIERADRGELADADMDALLSDARTADALRDPLVLAVLENAQACDRGFERFLTAARRALLRSAAAGTIDARLLPFACALARQCFLGDYVFACGAGEAEQAAALGERLANAARSGVPVDASALAALAAYVPLDSLPWPADFAQRAWEAPARDLLAQQILQPRAEHVISAGIAALTAITGPVSHDVRQQYEESPYPRWVRLPAPEPMRLEVHLRTLFPALAGDHPLAGRVPEVLIAGCGTGQESSDLAQRFVEARVLAIDLSRASLAYAARKASEMGIANLEYAQADLLALDESRTFDVISSVGVLHHLRDPQAGLRRLAALLRPGGFMQIGLYSERGRRDLEPVRELIAERGWKPVPADIRRCREAVLGDPRHARVAALRDLYGLNECRDLLFHVEEHRYRLPEVKAMVESAGLEPLGPVVAPAIARAFRARFAAGTSAADLDAWDAFEGEHPDTFSGMYLLWLRKPPR